MVTGASGRNGGWAVGELAGSFEKYAKRSSADEALRQARAVFDAVDEIGRVTSEAGIGCDYQKGGWIRLARNRPQADRMRDEIEHEHRRGFTDEEFRLLEPDEARGYLNATQVEAGVYFAPCASLHPAKLAAGLATHLERDGVAIAEGTTVTSIVTGPMGDNKIVTDRGTVSAEVVVRATEAYTRDLEGMKLDLLPVYSLMVATEPLSQELFDEIGLADRPTFSDDRFMVIYGQRTADDRLAFGGRGVPYLFGSRISRSAELHEPSHELLRETLFEMLPILRENDVGFTHRWGGVLGIPRNWTPGVRYDRQWGYGDARGVRGRGCRRRESRRTHDGRAHRRRADAADIAAVGRGEVAILGARAAALAGRAGEPPDLGGGRRPRIRHRRTRRVAVPTVSPASGRQLTEPSQPAVGFTHEDRAVG